MRVCYGCTGLACFFVYNLHTLIINPLVLDAVPDFRLYHLPCGYSTTSSPAAGSHFVLPRVCQGYWTSHENILIPFAMPLAVLVPVAGRLERHLDSYVWHIFGGI
jgi:hypothetical protein